MKHSLILFILTFLLAGCTKSYIPCSGDDCFYFVCKVDGEVYRPQCESEDIFFGCSAVDVRYYQKGSKDLSIYIDNEERDEAINIKGLKINAEDKYYSMFIENEDDYKTKYYSGPVDCRKYIIDTEGESDRLYITEIDTINSVIGGEFNFTAFNECTGDPVEVTEGKFRLNYIY